MKHNNWPQVDFWEGRILKTSIPKLTIAVALSLAGVASTGVMANAASGGYGPSSAVPVGVPGGFSSTIFASTFASSGGHALVRDGGTLLNINIAPGSFKYGFQMALTSANTNSIRLELKGKLHGDVPVFASGFVLERRGHPLGSKRPVTITITGHSLKRGDMLVEYLRGRFVPVALLMENGKVVLTLRGVTEFAVVAPKR